MDREVLNLNPDGWIQGVSNERNWLMLYGLDVCHEKQLITGGDSKGMVYFVDCRSPERVASHQIHKKGNKVCSRWLGYPEDRQTFIVSPKWSKELALKNNVDKVFTWAQAMLTFTLTR